ncbi:MAG: HlyC/CorC family transporter [Verrucomicrobia bacterium]|nr:HlyC/CorC family transporter [Verrucomicrobiota bacterium]
MNWDAIFAVAWKILAVLVLVGLNGFFVAAEFALVKVRDTQLDPLILRGHRRATLARHLIHNLDAYLSAAQVGITLASLGLGWVGEPIFADLLAPVFRWLDVTSEGARHTVSFAVGFSVITFLHIVVGEMAPKSFAIKHPLPTALWLAYPLKWFFYSAYPVIWTLNHSSLWLLRQAGIAPAHEGEGAHSEEELRLLFAAAQRRAGGTKLGRDLVLNALDLQRRIVRQVMRPRQEITALDTHASIAECLEVAEKTRYSRFPLCEGGDLDRTHGVIHFKDLFAQRHKARTGGDLAAAARKLIYVPETARLERLLQLFLERKLHFAIVVDEYGGTTGMVTLENILEELVGQIQDEFDQEKPLLTATGTDVWDVAGNLPLHELEELVGEPLAAEGVTTTSGWVTQRLGGFAKTGDTLAVGRFELRVEEMDGPRIGRLKLTRAAPAGEPDRAANGQ